MAVKEYFVFAVCGLEKEWRAEGFDLDHEMLKPGDVGTGERYAATFHGPDAQFRALEYARFINAQLRALQEQQVPGAEARDGN